MIDQRAIKCAIEWLKAQPHISDIEKDILDTWTDYSSNPFDRAKAQNRIMANNIKYPEIDASISAMPQTIRKPFNIMTEEDLKYNLINQIRFLLLKDSHIPQND